MAAFGSRALVRAALVFALVVVGAAAAETAAHGGSKTLSGKICSKNDVACVKCSKSGKSFTCLACATGPVDAELNDAGRCVCPAGSALTGSKLTVKASGGSGGGNGKKGAASAAHGGKKSGPATCSECGENSYAPEAKPVSASRCKACPTGTTTRGETGSATCYVEPGYYFDPSKPDGQQVIVCPVDQYCPGGDIFGDGLNHFNCPAGSGTQGTTGNDALSDCIVPPGSYYNPDTGKVQPCDKNFYCSGGSVTGAGQNKTPCPAGSGTAGTGASTIGQCIVPPGSYFDGTNVVTCPVGKYCGGGPIGGGGNIATSCPPGTTTASTGSSTLSQCLVPPGSYFDGTNVVKCPVGSYCAGGPVDGAGKITTKCPAGTTTASTGSTSISQCLVPPGSYWDGSKVVTCTAGNYCTGGPVDGAGKDQTPCPPGETSNPGAATVGECFVACQAPNVVCSGVCSDLQTDSKNCGSCGNKCPDAETCFGGQCFCGEAGNVCPAGATCKPFGANDTPTCICDLSQQPVITPKQLTCNTLVKEMNAVQAYELDVTPGSLYTLKYDSYAVPDRFVVVEGSICAPPIVDTGFVGYTNSGCPQSSPCCTAGSSAGCTGVTGAFCPADPTAIPGPGGGSPGGTVQFTPTKSKVYVIGYGVCDVTGYDITVNCPAPP